MQYKIIGRAGASPPSRTTGPRCLYVYMYLCIRKYGSTFYIGIAMVRLPYFGHVILKLSFRFQFPLNLTSTNTKVENMLKANDIWKKIKNSL